MSTTPEDSRPDVLGPEWDVETIELPAEDDGELAATLVRRRATAGLADGPADGVSRGAVLHVHGFADYFFQLEYAAWWTERGYDFYALDLRRYGRSLRPGNLANHVADLAEHHPELDAAWERITVRDGNRRVVGSAHSTGGLTLPLWADDRRPSELVALVLNSPWLDLQGSPLMRTIGTQVIDRLARLRPLQVIPRDVSGVYARSLHRDFEGEWDFDLRWKPYASFEVRVAWLAAIRRGHARLHRGLGLTVPTLVLSSDRSTTATEMGEDVLSTDIVLDVSQIRRWAPSISSHVTVVAVPGALHDVVLSRAEPRRRVYETLGTWADAWLDGGSTVRSDRDR